jgi:hypothetical protein
MAGESGVTAKLASPLGALSRHYPWRWVPPGISALRLSLTGEGNTPYFVYGQMNNAQRDILEDKLGRVWWSCEGGTTYFNHDSDLVDAVEEIWDWMPKAAAAKCPYQSVMHDIDMVRALDDESLDRYVMSKLL